MQSFSGRRSFFRRPHNKSKMVRDRAEETDVLSRASVPENRQLSQQRSTASQCCGCHGDSSGERGGGEILYGLLCMQSEASVPFRLALLPPLMRGEARGCVAEQL
ncbi:hypothetical protein NDU88_007616 [Pleurodeles waltl]|uniref:Uncharacterized protein n=1 Tax=Pleurodeles waltl TaxID=8319 RepID=A0AAV7U215_PLEWA|nr:hypothetical protein NDU88_007616 [Pleurodeles waltl]